MSMPTFPDCGLDITEEQAFNMILGSIAMEELALSHILNAEGEKLQYVLGTLPGSRKVCPTTQEILEVNRSINRLLENVMYNQMLLKGKLEQVLEAKRCWHPCVKPECCPPCPLPEPYCKPVPCSFRAPHCCWKRGSALPWRCKGDFKACGCWQGCSDSSVYLSPGSAHLVSWIFRLRAPDAGEVCLHLQKTLNHSDQLITTEKACCEAPERPITVSGATVLPESSDRAAPPAIKFILDGMDSVTVEQAELTITEL